MGMVFASLGRERMVILKKGALEIPSDIDGVLRLEFNDHVKEVAVRLATRMKTAGIEIDDALIHKAGA
jgi:predicted nucleotide-binding protein